MVSLDFFRAIKRFKWVCGVWEGLWRGFGSIKEVEAAQKATRAQKAKNANQPVAATTNMRAT